MGQGLAARRESRTGEPPCICALAREHKEKWRGIYQCLSKSPLPPPSLLPPRARLSVYSAASKSIRLATPQSPAKTRTHTHISECAAHTLRERERHLRGWCTPSSLGIHFDSCLTLSARANIPTADAVWCSCAPICIKRASVPQKMEKIFLF